MRHFGYQDKILLLQHGSTELLSLAQRRGALLHKLLSGTGIFEQDLHKPHGRLHHNDWLKLLQNCQQQLNSPELPYLLGGALLNSRYISLCQSLQYAQNLRQAMAQLYYFRHQLFPCFYVRLYQQQHCILIEFKPALGLANQHAFMLTVVCSLLLGLVKQQLGSVCGISLQLQQAASHQLQHQLHWGVDVSFNQSADSISIPLALWQQRFADADAQKFSAYRRTCRQLNCVLSKQRALPESICRLQRQALPQPYGAARRLPKPALRACPPATRPPRRIRPTTTAWPCARSRGARKRPSQPEDPVRSTRMGLAPSIARARGKRLNERQIRLVPARLIEKSDFRNRTNQLLCSAKIPIWAASVSTLSQPH